LLVVSFVNHMRLVLLSCSFVVGVAGGGCANSEQRPAGRGLAGSEGNSDSGLSRLDAAAGSAGTYTSRQPEPSTDAATDGALSGDARIAVPQDSGSEAIDAGPINVLLYNASTGYGHQSRETAIPFLRAAAAANGITLDIQYALTAVEPEGPGDDYNYNHHLPGALPINNSAFVPGGLDNYDVVFFLNTGGTPLSFDGSAMGQLHQNALQDFLENKHRGFVGTHSASDSYQNNTWPWYVDMIGANFDTHSDSAGTVTWNPVVTHPILTIGMVPNPWHRQEEWYTFKRDVTILPDFTVLLNADVPQFPERPSAWVHELPGGARVFYTAFGHAVSAFQEPEVMRFIMTGIKWAAHRL
jgi:hypothetical protein